MIFKITRSVTFFRSAFLGNCTLVYTASNNADATNYLSQHHETWHSWTLVFYYQSSSVSMLLYIVLCSHFAWKHLEIRHTYRKSFMKLTGNLCGSTEGGGGAVWNWGNATGHYAWLFRVTAIYAFVLTVLSMWEDNYPNNSIIMSCYWSICQVKGTLWGFLLSRRSLRGVVEPLGLYPLFTTVQIYTHMIST